jgi:hypothetical protein
MAGEYLRDIVGRRDLQTQFIFIGFGGELLTSLTSIVRKRGVQMRESVHAVPFAASCRIRI